MKMAWFMAFGFACLLGLLLTYGIQDLLERRKPIAASNYTAEAERALQEYHADHGAYPEGDNHAITLVLMGENALHKDYLSQKRRHTPFERLLDPWDVEMRIRFVNGGPVVRSAGIDGVFDTPDDIGSAGYTALKPYPPLPDPQSGDMDTDAGNAGEE